MISSLTLSLDHITVNLPETHLIISKEEYLKLEKQASQGQYLTLTQVLDLLSVSRPWLLEHVLYNSKHRHVMDIEHNPEGFVKYPKNQGGKYLFLASKTKSYFEKHFVDILKQ